MRNFSPRPRAVKTVRAVRGRGLQSPRYCLITALNKGMRDRRL